MKKAAVVVDVLLGMVMPISLRQQTVGGDP
jgi:hypothetical protein